jgi:predicted phage terminase large subunit-like protein
MAETNTIAQQRKPRDRQIVLPRPLEHQIPVLMSPARYKVLVAGRRWGKTLVGLIAVVAGHGPKDHPLKGALQGGNIGWIAPSFPISNQIWGDLKKSLYNAWESKSEVERSIVLPTGGKVEVKSADNPDSMRGVGYDGIVLDECAMMTEETWTEVLRPTLSDRQGWAMFISTPRWQATRGQSGNWFRQLYEDATEPGWERWQRPTSDNKLIPTTEIEAAKKDIGSLPFQQEYMAQFITPSGIFKRETFRYYSRQGDQLRLQGYGALAEKMIDLHDCVIFSTVDLAASTTTIADYTVVATWAHARTGEIMLLDLLRGRFEGGKIQELIMQAYNKWKPSNIWIEKVGFQLELVKLLRNPPYGLPIRELIADKNKVSRALLAVAKYESGMVYHPVKAAWLDDFEFELLSFPQATYDDQVDCVAYAMTQAIGRAPRAYFL